MSEVLLQRSEFVALLNAVHAQAVVGIPRDSLFPREAVSREQLIGEGEERLLRRGLLLVGSNGLRLIDTTLCAIMTVVARPDLAAIVSRHTAGAGPQVFLLYQSGELTVEQTLPHEGMHRLALLGSPAALIERLEVILPVHTSGGDATTGEIGQDALFEVKRQADAGHGQQALSLLQAAGLSDGFAGALMQAMEHPQLDGTVAFMRCHGDTISDARDIALVCGSESAWVVHQRVPGVPILNIETTDAFNWRQLIIRYHDELMAVA